ncbi:hypothetical protein GQ53DRAFT_751569 [Thozetella sp. PMI_491]|nr:hypothetical protein GQ53DRAFT_751569 [Thozetella sp. PMI_491]
MTKKSAVRNSRLGFLKYLATWTPNRAPTPSGTMASQPSITIHLTGDEAESARAKLIDAFRNIVHEANVGTSILTEGEPPVKTATPEKKARKEKKTASHQNSPKNTTPTPGGARSAFFDMTEDPIFKRKMREVLNETGSNGEDRTRTPTSSSMSARGGRPAVRSLRKKSPDTFESNQLETTPWAAFEDMLQVNNEALGCFVIISDQFQGSIAKVPIPEQSHHPRLAVHFRVLDNTANHTDISLCPQFMAICSGEHLGAVVTAFAPEGSGKSISIHRADNRALDGDDLHSLISKGIKFWVEIVGN